MIRRRPHLPKRRYRRLTVRVEVEYSSDAGPCRELATTLGAGGLFVACDDPLVENTPLSLCFRLPGLDRPWKIEGRVAWSDASGMGVEFVDRAAIARLAEELESWSADR